MATNIAYLSGLRPGYDPHELLAFLELGAKTDDIVSHVQAHNKGAVFLVFREDHFVDTCILKYNGSTIWGNLITVSRPTPSLTEQLRRLNPSIFETQLESTQQQTRNTDDSTAVKAVLEAIANLSLAQKDLLNKALAPPTINSDTDATTRKSAAGPPPGFNSPTAAIGGQAQPRPPLHINPEPDVRRRLTAPLQPQPYGPSQTPGYGQPQSYPVGQLQSTPHQLGQPSFHFGLPSTAHSVRVSTFSGSPHDCSFEQFRYDVQCLVNQGASEGIILLAIKRAIKGQAQEIALHMGETATVADILSRFEMMFGDVNPPHVLLAQFYAAEQKTGESITDWYSRIEDIASRIIRKDSTVISPNNYDVIVNTQFWTKMQDQRIKNALRHKFDMLSGSPQFIIEARKVESECQAEAVRSQQVHTDIAPAIQKGLESLISRMDSLEGKLKQTAEVVDKLQPHKRNFKPQTTGKTDTDNNNNRKSVCCFYCRNLGHIKRNCPALNSTGSDVRSAPAPQ